MKCIDVVFVRNQGVEDIFRSADDYSKLYVRQPQNNKENVSWLSGNKWSGGVEASCPLKSDIEIRIVERQDNLNIILFTETLEQLDGSEDTYARKTAPFSYEAIKEIAEKYRSDYNLKTHNEWKEWLLKYKGIFAPDMINDNWLYCSADSAPASTRPIKISYLGKNCCLLKEHCFHRIARLWWDSYTLVDSNGNTLEICGYVIVGENKGEMLND